MKIPCVKVETEVVSGFNVLSSCASHPSQEKAERKEGKRTKSTQGEGSPSDIYLETGLLLDFTFLTSETLDLIL